MKKTNTEVLKLTQKEEMKYLLKENDRDIIQLLQKNFTELLEIKTSAQCIRSLYENILKLIIKNIDNCV